ncbi:sigma-70 family RNA polymerase sigma factor [Chitinophaga silvatica]|uniref:RNA polymerase sigma factor n=1 Tax=Chitinophaga silvatica TaxID=2282649 RepID=A0A3E1YFI8_9BACT|nr:sigma-70 family RNA polymerase sigma factor [Chitinophaga silvatica]RFS25087.1 sigma-70 family RNA polymerase sigma factor [Chitinophaga silvatica]
MKFLKPHNKEDELLARAKLGSDIAIREIVDSYSKYAFTIAFGVLANREDAEEIVQDAFLKAFTSLDKFKQTSKFSTWLYKIVYHTALNKYQSNKTISVNATISDNLHYIPTNLQSWDNILNNERKKYVDSALSQLEHTDRSIITLHYIAEKSISEICEITGYKKSAIKMRLLRSRKQLEGYFNTLLNQEIRELL